MLWSMSDLTITVNGVHESLSSLYHLSGDMLLHCALHESVTGVQFLEYMLQTTSYVEGHHGSSAGTYLIPLTSSLFSMAICYGRHCSLRFYGPALLLIGLSFNPVPLALRLSFGRPLSLGRRWR